MQVLYFGAPWCGPCKSFKPLVEQTVKEMNVRWTDINVDYDPNMSQKYEVSSIPTIVIVDNQGGQLYKHTGVMAKSQLEAAFNNFKQA
jgi:thiol-disulfide isomerase/thioredoxin